MGSIFVLDAHTISKIAAGEVVDRPASVVKELLENSVDVGSKRIVVEVTNGGRSSIKVTDNGCGISEEDVELAFQKHATSKIRKIEDLTKIKSLGFRGEALPSIAAVSRVEISTRDENEDFGSYLSIEGGEIKEKRRITRSVGTTIEVKSLFYNLPARIATISSKSTEFRHIIDVFTSYAIIHPNIKFELFHDGKLVTKTLATGKMKDSLVSVYGRSIAEELIELPLSSYDNGTPISINGYISKLSTFHSTKKHMLTYVNGRFVRSEVIDKAIKRGYMSLLPRNAYPFAVISLSIDPSETNVNIHPKKQEIRFYKKEKISRFIAKTITETLQKADLIPDFIEKEERANVNFYKEHFPSIKLEKGEKKAIQVSFPETGDIGIESGIKEEKGGKESSPININFAPLYQLHDSYIIGQNENGDIIIIDQHAAAERINFERFIARYGSRIEKQALLRPYVPALSPHQFYLLRENEKTLKEMGFDIERFGEDSYIIRAIPVIFQGMIGKERLIEVIEHLLEDRGKKEERINTLYSTAACIASIKAGEKLPYVEMREIVEGLKNAKMPFTCPHGRPTMIRLSKKEIEKKFHRK